MAAICWSIVSSAWPWRPKRWIAVVMLDVFDCGDAEKVAKRIALYTGYGFEPLPSNGLRLFLPIATVRTLMQADA